MEEKSASYFSNTNQILEQVRQEIKESPAKHPQISKMLPFPKATEIE